VLLLNYNSAEHTIPCIESLLASDYPNLRIIVVDNGSTDGSPAVISKRFPCATLIRLPSGIAMAAARNLGIRRALEEGCSHLAILDNDTRADKRLVSHLVETCERHRGAVAVSPKIYWLRHPERFWFVYGRLSLWTGVYSNPAYNAVDRGQYETEMEVEIVSTCCFLMPRRIAERVQFDDSLCYNDDVEWSLRCQREGFRIVYCPKAKVWHVVGGGQGKSPPALLRYLWTRDQWRTLRKYARPWQMASLVLLYPLRFALRLVKLGGGGRWDCVGAELRGTRDGLLAPLDSAEAPRAEPSYHTPGL
jgi:hypothetical protein